MNTAPCRSAVSYIDGDKGILRYRGYPIEELAEHSTFLEVAYLLLYGSLPSAKQLADWQEAVMRHSALPQGVAAALSTLPHDAHPMGALLTGLATLGAYHPEANPAVAGQGVYKQPATRDKQCVRLLGKMPALAAAAYHLRTGRAPAPPRTDLTYAESFLYQLDAGLAQRHTPHPRLARALDVMFILHAEHEMNCSTAAARHLASSGVDVYTVVGGAVGALYGPLHGGANEAVLRMLSRIGSPADIPAFLEAVKARKEILFGFGHRCVRGCAALPCAVRRPVLSIAAGGGFRALHAPTTITNKQRVQEL
jgi:citrate synthase